MGVLCQPGGVWGCYPQPALLVYGGTTSHYPHPAPTTASSPPLPLPRRRQVRHPTLGALGGTGVSGRLIKIISGLRSRNHIISWSHILSTTFPQPPYSQIQWAEASRMVGGQVAASAGFLLAGCRPIGAPLLLQEGRKVAGCKGSLAAINCLLFWFAF